MKKIFIDTNIIIYANDLRQKAKQETARKLITGLIKLGGGVISVQVMQEYAYVALKKLRQSYEVVLRQLKLLESFEVVKPAPDLIRRAIEIMQTYKIGFWDACIISHAESAGCPVIYSEDLNTGQYYAGIKIENPFA